MRKDEEETCLLSWSYDAHFAGTIPTSHSLWQPFTSECVSGLITTRSQQTQLKQKMLMLMLEKAAAEQRETMVTLRSPILLVYYQWVTDSHVHVFFTYI